MLPGQSVAFEKTRVFFNVTKIVFMVIQLKNSSAAATQPAVCE